MSFIDDLYSPQPPKKVPAEQLVHEINGMVEAIQNTVRSEHANGKRSYKGYFWRQEGDYSDYWALKESTEKLTDRSNRSKDRPLDEMAKLLSQEVNGMGFRYYRVYCDSIIRYEYRFKHSFSFTEKLVPICKEKVIWVELGW